MHIPHIKAGPFPGQAARPQGRQPPLVRQLCQRVGLVHKLRQLGAAKELPYRRHYRPDVDQALRCGHFLLDQRHLFLDHPLHPQQPDANLVLHQFPHRAHPPVAQMVNVVRHTLRPLLQQTLPRQQVQVILPSFSPVHQQHRAEDIHDVVRRQDTQASPFTTPQPHIELVAAYFAQVVAAAVKERTVQQVLRVLQARRFPRPHLAVKVNLRGRNAPNRGFVIFVSSRRHGFRIPVGITPPDNAIPSVPQIIILKVRQFPLLHHRVPLQGAADILVPAISIRFRRNPLKKGHDFLVAGVTQSPQERSNRNFALPIHFDRQHIPRAGIKLQPRAPGRNNLRRPLVFLRRAVVLEIDPRGTHQLADHYPLGPIDDKGAVLGHLGDVPHKDVLLLNLPGFLHHQLRLDRQRLRIGHFPRLAFQRILLRLAEVMLPEVQLVLLAGVVGNRRNFRENLPQPFAPEPLVGLRLTQNEIRHLQHLGNPGIGLDRGRRRPIAVAVAAISVAARGKLPVRDGSNRHAPISLFGCRSGRRRMGRMRG